MARVLFPLTANPFHKGHEQVLEQAKASFGEVIIALPKNPSKDAVDREFLKWTLTPLGYKVVLVEGLVADVAKALNCDAIVRGIRGTDDCKYEFEMADWNMTLGDIPTWFLYGAPELNKLSSTALRTIHESKGDLDPFVNKFVFNRWLNGRVPSNNIYFGPISVGKSTVIPGLEKPVDLDHSIWNYVPKDMIGSIKANMMDAITAGDDNKYQKYMRQISRFIDWKEALWKYGNYEAPALGAWWKLIPPEVLCNHRLVKVNTDPDTRMIFAHKRGLTEKTLQQFDKFYKDPPFFDEEITVRFDETIG